MKTLMIMRHGKSDWQTGERDFDRPLNKRGLKAAALMGNEILKRELVPDLIISSLAVRAKTTAEIVAENCNYSKEIAYNENFYFGYLDKIKSEISNLDNNLNSVLLFGHNPTWSELVLYYSGEIISMVTASVAVLTIDSNNWNELARNKCKLNLYLKPKNLK